MPPRLLSHTEIETAMSCWARHAFAYTGHLTEGTTLRRRAVARTLSEGRAHGRAAATWHAKGNTLLAAFDASEALYASLREDEVQMLTRGVELGPDEWTDITEHLLGIEAHYMSVAPPLSNLTREEDRIEVPIPSRTGRQGSTRYRFECFIDGWNVDDDQMPWLVEFKLRKRLTPLVVLQNDRQLRRMAWALRKYRGIEPVGVIVDERLNAVPKPARVLKSGKPSHAKDQLTTAESYVAVCQELGDEPHPDTLDHLRAQRWQQRVPIIFRPDEIDEAGEELASAAKLIRDLDSKALAPIRHASTQTCNGCRFKEICPNPQDDLLVDTLFERTVPKRLREKEEVA